MEDLGCGCCFIILAVFVAAFAFDVCRGIIGWQIILCTIAAILLVFGITGVKDGFK
jgi:hypothetical protein